MLSHHFPFTGTDGQSIFSVQALTYYSFFKGKAFFSNCTHLLTRTQEKTFEDVFLIKIANK